MWTHFPSGDKTFITTKFLQHFRVNIYNTAGVFVCSELPLSWSSHHTQTTAHKAPICSLQAADSWEESILKLEKCINVILMRINWDLRWAKYIRLLDHINIPQSFDNKHMDHIGKRRFLHNQYIIIIQVMLYWITMCSQLVWCGVCVFVCVYLQN